MITERERKKAEKEKKRAAAEVIAREKEAAFQAKLVEQFNEKQAKASAAKTPQ